MLALVYSGLLASILAWGGGEPLPAAAQLEVDAGTEPQAIYGGEPVEPGDWPAVVSVATSSRRCTGTLVSPTLVLTAAHCLDPAPVGPVQIQFGDSVNPPSIQVSSSDWGVHEDFCLPADCGEDLHDFGWVLLSQPVNNVEPILPITDQAEFDEGMRVGVELVFVGYGEDEDQQIGIKREVTASLTSFTESGREFRAGGDGKDTCSGDSGGPALVRLGSGEVRLAGVLSRGGACGGGGIYGVPMPELCWLRDSSGVDLLPAGCEACDCVMLAGEQPDDGCDCSLATADLQPGEPGSGWALLGLGLLVGAGVWRRRRVRAGRAKIGHSQ